MKKKSRSCGVPTGEPAILSPPLKLSSRAPPFCSSANGTEEEGGGVCFPPRRRHPPILSDDLDMTKKKDFRGFFPEGYIINKLLIRLSFIPVLVVCLLGILTYGLGEHIVVKCPSEESCANPFYSGCQEWYMPCASDKAREIVCAENPGFCLMPLLPPGFQYGEEMAGWLVVSFWIALAFPFMAVGANHLFFNRGWKK